MRKVKLKDGTIHRFYEVGDKVKIIRQDIFHLKEVQGKNRWGTITEIDGGYIYVRPRYKRWTIELYDCEIAPR